ncbi:hypothetical protein [Ferrimonas aestuarii]|uniref:Fibronectin type-III domain-containing protein n=1 Tax=Ferrimonas aestuarii TaxID=2569539 RepID=A0A4U1BT40_9GAMM|nr:hypothetical protein [Ferrimonas aestuarii]TKB56710.1 hypothetical protein FCL42_06140 [Ferrimonas aestuarii]
MFKTSTLSMLIMSAGLGLSAEAANPERTQYYEEQQRFHHVPKESYSGWGWSPSSIYQSASYDSETSGGGGGGDEPPPETRPSAPANLSVLYTPGQSQVTISWATPADKGNGSDFKYEIYRVDQGQASELIRSQSSTSKFNYNLIHDAQSEDTSTSTSTSTATASPTASVSASSGYAELVPTQFRIRACNSAGCSSSQSSPFIMVAEPKVDVPTQTLLERSRQILSSTSNANYRKSATTYTNGELAVAQGVLGQGIDMLNAEPVENSYCWNASSQDKVSANVTRLNRQSMSFSKVDTYESLQTSLDLKRSGGINLSFGGFSIGAKSKKAIYSKTKKVTESSVIVAHFLDEQNKFTAKPAIELDMKSAYVDMLKPMNATKKLEFRKACGDNYINSIITGRELTATIRIFSEHETASETKSKTSGLQADLQAYSADGNFDSSELSQMNSEYRNYTFEVLVYQSGSSTPGDIIRLTTPEALFDVMNQFASSSNQDLVAISSTDAEYPIPELLDGELHFDVFANYVNYQNRANAWMRLDEQLYQRCWMLDTEVVGAETAGDMEEVMGDRAYVNGQSESFMCDASKTVIEEGMRQCTQQSLWSGCYYPTEPLCEDALNGGQCMDRMEQISYKAPRSISHRLDVSRGGCAIGPCKRSKSMTTCFTDASVFPDLSRNDVISSSYQTQPVAGVSAQVDRAWQVNYANNSLSAGSDAKYCLKSSAQVYGKGAWGSGGRYESLNKVFGFKPIQLDYSL